MTRNCLSAECQHIVFERAFSVFFSWTNISFTSNCARESWSPKLQTVRNRGTLRSARGPLGVRSGHFARPLSVFFKTLKFKWSNNYMAPIARCARYQTNLLASWNRRTVREQEKESEREYLASSDTIRAGSFDQIHTVAAIQLLACVVHFGLDTVRSALQLAPDGTVSIGSSLWFSCYDASVLLWMQIRSARSTVLYNRRTLYRRRSSEPLQSGRLREHLKPIV